MRLILIRHGDPDYVNDSLTEKGVREANLLAERTKSWHVDDVYVSPLGRAQRTAEPSLKNWGMVATVLPWAKEFFYLVHGDHGEEIYPWDFYPSAWTGFEENFDENEWINREQMSPIKDKYDWVTGSLDEFLRGYGYERTGRYYRVKEHSDKTVVIFCHFGVSMIFLSHLLNISAQALLHGMFLAPTSVTVLNTEERTGDEAYFRVERLGDCSHLIKGGEPISSSGYFTPVMQELD